MKKILFDRSATDFILDSFDKKTDQDGYVVEKKNPKQRVLTLDGQEIRKDQFGGIRKGSEIFIKSDLPSLIQLLDDLKK